MGADRSSHGAPEVFIPTDHSIPVIEKDRDNKEILPPDEKEGAESAGTNSAQDVETQKDPKRRRSWPWKWIFGIVVVGLCMLALGIGIGYAAGNGANGDDTVTRQVDTMSKASCLARAPGCTSVMFSDCTQQQRPRGPRIHSISANRRSMRARFRRRNVRSDWGIWRVLFQQGKITPLNASYRP